MFTKKKTVLALMLVLPLTGCPFDSDDDDKKVESEKPLEREEPLVVKAKQVRDTVAENVSGLDKLVVPATNEEIPVPVFEDEDKNQRIKTTEAKRYLGKQLFHDSIRTVRIDESLGGRQELLRTGSCGSCHFGEAASKAGTQFNFNLGGEGKGYIDAEGNFQPRRRARMDILEVVDSSLRGSRAEPKFEGDLLVDHLPTLTDVRERRVGLPSIGDVFDDAGDLKASGRFDAVDSVARNAPSVIGSAFNNRLLGGGLAGEPQGQGFAINPFEDAAQENITLLLLDAHRMLDAQNPELQKFEGYIHLFREAFPEEAAQADEAKANGDDKYLDKLINDETVLRATATFIRTVVTRNTPWDKFLAGDNKALTESQLRGAELFFTPVEQGGAGCYSCHSGPMLNKQHNDPDVAGVGEFVEENFHNLGLKDHPLQAVNAHIRGDDEYRDEGRAEVTGNKAHLYKHRTVTLRQLKDARVFFHNGAYTSVKQVVEYFNAGVAEDDITGKAETLSKRFTYPRGEGGERGLGLSEQEVNDLVAFIEDGLYDPAFVEYNPDSTTDTFQLNEKDVTYSKYRPELAARGVKDGFVISGMAQNNNDPLTRRDVGMEFLPVDTKTEMERTARTREGIKQQDKYTITNTSDYVIDTDLILVIKDLPSAVNVTNRTGLTLGGVDLQNPDDTSKVLGMTDEGHPYIKLKLDDGVIDEGKSVDCMIELEDNRDNPSSEPVSYKVELLSGQGNP